MIEAICPLCGIGVLEESPVDGYECSNCGEVIGSFFGFFAG